MSKSPVIDLDRTYTADEFEQLPEFAANFELVDGKLREKSVPGFEHSWIADLIRIAFHEYDPQKKFGTLLTEVNTRLEPHYVPQPDLSFWKATRRPNPRTKGAGTRPDLAIEIWSPSDLESAPALQEARAKIARYLNAGVPLVWAINPANQIVEVYHPGQLEPLVLDVTASLEGEDIIPGFRLPVNNLFVDEGVDEGEDGVIAQA